MSLKGVSHDMNMVTHALHAVFLYAACTTDGYVKVGISRTPFDRIYQIHCGSPSPVRAAQWTWIGSLNKGREIEKRIRKEWDARNTRGEWYKFDYASPCDKREFHDTLAAVVEVVVGKSPEWNRLGPQEVAEIVRAGGQIMRDRLAGNVAA